jgi:tRNA(adenine34) deaminase
MDIQQEFMRQVLTLADKAMQDGELPIAALVVLDGEVIARAATAEKRLGRYLVHAEMTALNQADRLGLTYQERTRTCLYTNLEPCLMCMGAAMSFSLGEVVYSLESPGDGAVNLVRGWVRREEDLPTYRVPDITGGLLRNESLRLFKKCAASSPPGPMRDWAACVAHGD